MIARTWSGALTTISGPFSCQIGWGGRIRTFTILINSEVSYRLDHAPAVLDGFREAQKLMNLSAEGRSGISTIRITRTAPSDGTAAYSKVAPSQRSNSTPSPLLTEDSIRKSQPSLGRKRCPD